MNTKLWRVIFAGLFVVVIVSAPGASVAQEERSRYFPETGHWVTGEYLEYYESVPNPILVFGYPITDEIQTQTISQIPGVTVQYFQRARFELHPENPQELRVILSQLGEYLYEIDQPGPIVPVSASYPACRLFDTGYQVCYAFLEFFDKHGGIVQFGYPISEIEIHENRLVQYFQRARFEWHPELPAGQRVVLTHLGDIYFSLFENPVYKRAPDSIGREILFIQTHAFVSSAVMPADGTQRLYVIVQDQNLNPMANAQVVFTLQLPSGTETRYIMPLTNEDGYTYLDFSHLGQPNGMAEIFVTVTFGGFQTQTITSYRIWW